MRLQEEEQLDDVSRFGSAGADPARSRIRHPRCSRPGYQVECAGKWMSAFNGGCVGRQKVRWVRDTCKQNICI